VVGPEQKVVVDDDMLPGSREQYRRLAAALHQMQATTGLKVVMISSALASEGKTLTASNLALTLSESYRQRVLLIDADFRRPSLHTFFRIAGVPGLTDCLAAVTEQPLPLHRITPTLTLLPAGRPSSDPMAGLTSERMRRLIEEARSVFTWVIVDTPPVGLLTDANLLAATVDGALMVVRADSTPYPLVKRAVETLGADRILGVVLNSATARPHGYADYDKYYYATPAATS
jgi:capsular exopolysaccharide synthesis family protein